LCSLGFREGHCDLRRGRGAGKRMVPMRMERFRLRRADADDAAWLAGTLSETSERFGCRVIAADDGVLALRW
jgi:hypothetical protein